MPIPKSAVPPAAQPKLGNNFDPWNSSGTGHQRAENKIGGSTGWRMSRNQKLSHQFKRGGAGGEMILDTVKTSSEDWHEKAKARVPKSVRARTQLGVRDMLIGKASSKIWNATFKNLS